MSCMLLINRNDKNNEKVKARICAAMISSLLKRTRDSTAFREDLEEGRSFSDILCFSFEEGIKKYH